MRKPIAGVLVVILTAPLADAAVALPQQASGGQLPQCAPYCQDRSQDSNKPGEKPGADKSKAEADYPDSPIPIPAPTSDRGGEPTASQSAAEAQQSGDQKPVGIAAAPYEKTTGVAASRPAGAVIAPAKQRRARSILIRIGVVAGAAVAVGTVIGLSRGSSGRPN